VRHHQDHDLIIHPQSITIIIDFLRFHQQSFAIVRHHQSEQKKSKFLQKVGHHSKRETISLNFFNGRARTILAAFAPFPAAFAPFIVVLSTANGRDKA
jgi:hypothetical protein